MCESEDAATTFMRCYICKGREEMFLPPNILNRYAAAVDLARARGWEFVIDRNQGAWCCPQCHQERKHILIQPSSSASSVQGTGAQFHDRVRCVDCYTLGGDEGWAVANKWTRLITGSPIVAWRCLVCHKNKDATSVSNWENRILTCSGCNKKMHETYKNTEGWTTLWRGNTKVYYCEPCFNVYVKASKDSTKSAGLVPVTCCDCKSTASESHANRTNWAFSITGDTKVWRCRSCYLKNKHKAPDPSATLATYRPSMEVVSGTPYLAAKSRYEKPASPKPPTNPPDETLTEEHWLAAEMWWGGN